MAIEFYAGHNFKWIQKFLDAIPENKWYHKHIAFCLACCIHHQFIYKKQSVFKLTHKKLNLFCINRKKLIRYLEIFQQAKLIKYEIQKRKAPIITLLLLPSTINNKQQLTKIPSVCPEKHIGMSRKVNSPCPEKSILKITSKEPTKETTKEPTKETTKEPSKEPTNQDKNILGIDKWYSPYSKGFYEQIDKELERVQNKKKKVGG